MPKADHDTSTPQTGASGGEGRGYDWDAAHVGLPGSGLNGPLTHTHPQW
jgi:hypothetical protein